MEDKRPVAILTIAALVFFFYAAPGKISAYEPRATHAALTQEIAALFNKEHPNRALSEQDVEFIIQGSIDEDSPLTRPLRHFYDPINNQGLKLPFLNPFPSSKVWAEDTLDQASGERDRIADGLSTYFSAETDYSWERAIYEYAWGDKERGLKTLGHILHLLEDAAVPDHTRNDPHPPFGDAIFHEASPYEGWTEQFTRESIKVIDSLGRRNPVALNSLGEYFDVLALFSNENFFSKDTIVNYSSPSLNNLSIKKVNGVIYGVNTINYYGEYNLVRLEEKEKKSGKVLAPNFDTDETLLSDYWNILSQEAVLHGAGAVGLFFDAVEEERRTKVLFEKNRSIFKERLKKIFGIAKSLYGSSVTFDEVNSPQGAAVAGALQEQEGEQVEAVLRVEEVAPVPIPVEPVLEEERVVLSEEPLVEGETTEFSTEPEVSIPIPEPIYTIPSPGYGGGGGGSSSSSSSTPAPAPADTTAPDLATSVPLCTSASIGSSDCVLVASSAGAQWSSSASDLAFFTINKNGTYSTTTATTTTLSLSDGAYSFGVSATDTSGNRSATTTISITVSLSPVVINEIAWGGTATSFEDEWIELYNRTGSSISLSSFILWTQSGTPYIPLSGSIAANGYYLIEIGDDTAVSDVTADLVFPPASAVFVDTGEPVFLGIVSEGATTTVDEIPECGGSWCAGEANTGASNAYATMERMSSDVSGSTESNWHDNILHIRNGEDAIGDILNGTPKARNGSSYLIANGSSLSSDKTLTAVQSPYIVISTLTVNSGVTLVLEAGTVVKTVSNDEPSIIINGTLTASGTEENPVILTSFNDDEYGGDLNADGSATAPSPGSWGQLRFNATAGDSSLKHTLVRYGEFSEGSGADTDGLVTVVGSSPSFDYLTVEYSRRHGLLLSDSSSSVTHSTFRNNTTISGAAGLSIISGAPTVSDSTFSGNKIGLELSDSDATVSNATFTDNEDSAVSSIQAPGTFSGFSASGNGINGVVLSGNDFTVSGATTTLMAAGIPYVISGTPSVVNGSGLSICPGVIVKGQTSASYLSVADGGLLDVTGSSASDVVFTSIYDGSVGGDTQPSFSTTPAAGNWSGVVVLSGGSATLSGFTVRYAGGSAVSDRSGLRVRSSASAAVSNALIEESMKYGVKVEDGGVLTMSNSTIRNTAAVLSVSVGLHITEPGAATLNSVSFSGNTRYDIEAVGSPTITCTNCGTPTTNPADLLD